MKVRPSLVSFVFAGLSTLHASAQEAQRPDLASYIVGENWEWNEKLVADADPSKAIMESFDSRTVVLEAGEKKFLKKSAHGSHISSIDVADAKPNPKPFRKWPLKVGKKWAFEDNWASGDGTTGSTQQNAEIVAYEKVVVPSGTYSAFKIVYIGHFKNSRGSGEMNDTFWYVPELKADVKHLNQSGGQTYTSELVKYTKSSN